ncbi:MAG TPA: VWA domain-containing protein [Methanotrichaceae archaeon]|nr:VWA domain-containing protein [Methanotrichaceae archaeon]
MRKLCLLLPLLSLGLLWSQPGVGSSLPSTDDSDQEAGWYSFDNPDNAGKLIEEGQLLGQNEKNELWIVDLTGKEQRTSLEMPSSSWSRLSILPAVDGELKLYCRYPTGSVDLLLSDNVRSGRSYGAWLQAELEGDYEAWYTVDESKSNSILIHVENPEIMYEAAPAAGVAAMPQMAMPSPSPGSSIGFSTGGAKDINNFRENIEQGYLPIPTDITYEGLFYDYYFDTGQQRECQKLFCPSYSYAVSRDPFSKEPEHYLSVGLNSGITDFQRKKLNLVVVLDYSGSMGSPFDEYYYDRFGNRVELAPEESGRTKMEIADQSVVALLSHLKEDDRFGLVIFSDDAFLFDPLTSVGDKDLDKLKEHILNIREYGGTYMEAGMEKGTTLFGRYLEADKSEYENRIIFLTDAMPNIGETGESDLLRMLEENAAKGIYTTFIGIGVDFNTELVEKITKIKGANYYSVHSAGEFKERMDDEFDFMVTPLVFDLLLDLGAPGYEIEKVYGSPEADQATGEIMKVNTLFPSKTEEGQVKGGMVLIKLRKLSPEGISSEGSMKLKVSYRDRNGIADSDEAEVEMPETQPDYYQNNGIRKAILLSRYADLLKDWTLDERKAAQSGQKIVPSVTFDSGIVIPIELGEWERQSLPMQVAEPYRKLFGVFRTYFEEESQAIGDDSLQQEQVVLEKLKNYQE